MRKKRLSIIVLIVALILLIPLIAMQFTDEVNWTLFDFSVAAVILLCTGWAIDLVIRKVKSSTYRIILSLAIIAILFLIWAELAVGIFETYLSGE